MKVLKIAEKLSWPLSSGQAPSGYASNTSRNICFFFTFEAMTVYLRNPKNLAAIAKESKQL